MLDEPTNRGELGRREFMGHAALAGALAAGIDTFARPGRVALAAPARALRKTLKFGMVKAEAADGRKLNVEERLSIAKQAGFESVEPDTVFDDTELKAMKTAADKVGIHIDAFVCSTHWSSPLSDPDPAVWEKTMEGMRVSIQNARDVGADMVLLVPAVVTPQVMYRDAYARAVERTKQLAKDAAKAKITIGIENVWNKFLLSPLEGKKFIEDIDSDSVKFWFDIGNVVLFGYPQDWIRTLGPLIARVDIKDFDAKARQFVPLQEGSVDWPETMRALDEIGYKGYIAAEVQGGDLAYLTETVSKRMDAIFAG